jgi:hypothetical protein
MATPWAVVITFSSQPINVHGYVGHFITMYDYVGRNVCVFLGVTFDLFPNLVSTLGYIFGEAPS